MAIWAQGGQLLIWVSMAASTGHQLQYGAANFIIQQSRHNSNSGVLVPLSYLVLTTRMMFYVPDCFWVSIWGWMPHILDCLVKDLCHLMFIRQNLFFLAPVYYGFGIIGFVGFYLNNLMTLKIMHRILLLLCVIPMLGWQAVNFSIFLWVLLGYLLGNLLGCGGSCVIIRWIYRASHNDMDCPDFQLALIMSLNEYGEMLLYFCNILLPYGLIVLGIVSVGFGSRRAACCVVRLNVAPRCGEQIGMMPIVVLLVADVGDLWLICKIVISYVSSHRGSWLYCIVLVEFLWNWPSFWLVFIINVSCQLWQCVSTQFIVIAIQLTIVMCQFLWNWLSFWLFNICSGFCHAWYCVNVQFTLMAIPHSTIFNIGEIMWCNHCNCVHTFRLNFGDPLCCCSVLTYFTWHTGLWIGVTILVVIQQSWVYDQGLRNKTWIIFYYDCIIILKLSEARLYCLMYIFSYMILSFFLMVSESPGCDNPCGISKAFLSTAFGLRLSIIYCFAWLGWIVLWDRNKDGSVPGCATRTSVTPLVGEQPWTSAPRCALLPKVQVVYDEFYVF